MVVLAGSTGGGGLLTPGNTGGGPIFSNIYSSCHTYF